jgi:hypothetical protein
MKSYLSHNVSQHNMNAVTETFCSMQLIVGKAHLAHRGLVDEIPVTVQTLSLPEKKKLKSNRVL